MISELHRCKKDDKENEAKIETRDLSIRCGIIFWASVAL